MPRPPASEGNGSAPLCLNSRCVSLRSDAYRQHLGAVLGVQPSHFAAEIVIAAGAVELLSPVASPKNSTVLDYVLLAFLDQPFIKGEEEEEKKNLQEETQPLHESVEWKDGSSSSVPWSLL